MPRATRQTRPKAVTAASAKAKALAATIAAASPPNLTAPAAAAASPPPPPTLLFRDAAAWESWLEENHKGTEGLGVVWLKIGKKSCPERTVTYDEAVELALCFGWIDGQRKALDEHFFIQRFTPRRRKSIWSKRNVARVGMLKKDGKMRPAGQVEVDAAMADVAELKMASPPKLLLGDVLVTGGCGFLGHYIVRQLLEDSESGAVHVIDRDTTHNRIDGANYIKASITDEEKVRALVINDLRPRVIFHCASPNFSYPTLSAGTNDQYVSNVKGTEILLKAAKDSPHTEAFVFTSSVDMYSGAPHNNADETQPTWQDADFSPGVDAYRHSKALAARRVIAANASDGTGPGKLKTASLALAHMYGVRDSQLTRAMLDSYGAEGVPLVAIGKGENLVSVVSSENAAKAHLLAAKAMLDPSRANGKVAGETFNVAEDPPILFWHHMRTLWKAARGEAAVKQAWTMPGWVMEWAAFCVEWILRVFTLGFVSPPTMLSSTSISYVLYSHTYDSRKLRDVLGFHPKSSDHDRIVDEAVKWELQRRQELKGRKQE
ncbi:C-3 sterol dehydrogenase/C-4 decarboxylase [Pyricularia oryzae]|nr:C-3 sterol dehydrogenase/C-4 decarboxylase [Pyricularia oryzae]